MPRRCGNSAWITWGTGRDYGETPFIHWAPLPQTHGDCEDDLYPVDFKLFNQRGPFIKEELVAEVNRVTDFRVTVVISGTTSRSRRSNSKCGG